MRVIRATYSDGTIETFLHEPSVLGDPLLYVQVPPQFAPASHTFYAATGMTYLVRDQTDRLPFQTGSLWEGHGR
jgi:hypothetical protein